MEKQNAAGALAPAEKEVWPEISDIALIVLVEIYDHLIDEKSFTDGMSNLVGLEELVRHHPGLQKEVKAMQETIAGEHALNRLRGRVATI